MTQAQKEVHMAVVSMLDNLRPVAVANADAKIGPAHHDFNALLTYIPQIASGFSVNCAAMRGRRAGVGQGGRGPVFAGR